MQEAVRMAALLILLLCSVSFATGDLNRDCITDYRDIAILKMGWPDRGNFRDFALLANDWLKQEGTDCQLVKLQRDYFRLKKILSLKEFQDVLRATGPNGNFFVTGAK
jgi:hypothetical protein